MKNELLKLRENLSLTPAQGKVKQSDLTLLNEQMQRTFGYKEIEAKLVLFAEKRGYIVEPRSCGWNQDEKKQVVKFNDTTIAFKFGQTNQYKLIKK